MNVYLHAKIMWIFPPEMFYSHSCNVYMTSDQMAMVVCLTLHTCSFIPEHLFHRNMLASRGRRRTISRTSNMQRMTTGWHTAQGGKPDRHVKRANHDRRKARGFNVLRLSQISNRKWRQYTTTIFSFHLTKCLGKNDSPTCQLFNRRI